MLISRLGHLEGFARLQEVAIILDETWALVKDKDDAVKRYGTNPCNGKGYNSFFRKVLSRKLDEVSSFSDCFAAAFTCSSPLRSLILHPLSDRDERCHEPVICRPARRTSLRLQRPLHLWGMQLAMARMLTLMCLRLS